MDRVRKIEIFVRTADAGSFSKAALSLDLTPPAVSHAIAKLERELRVTLFYRTTRRMTLTEEGAEFYRRGQELLAKLGEVESTFSRTPDQLHGMLRVGITPTVQSVIMPAFGTFLRKHPDLQVEFHRMNYSKELHAEAVDVLLRINEPTQAGLVAREIAQVKYGIYASPGYLRAAGMPSDPGDLLRHRCLAHRPSWLPRPFTRWAFERNGVRKVIEIVPALVNDDRDALLAAAVGGSGVVRAGIFDPELVNSGRLREVLPEWNDADRRTIYAVYRRTARLAPKIVAFLNFAADAFAAFDPEERTVVHRR
jgi:LysR family transcriptional regulator for bpeEF and oprC